MKRRSFVALLVASLALLAPRADFAQQTPPPAIYGWIISNTQGPVQGATVSLVHPVLGRSAPAFSVQGGYYAFYNIPPRQEPFYIEVYWGQELLFRSQIYYTIPSSMRYDIRLP